MTVTENGRPYLVLMSPGDLESIESTLELLADDEALRRVEQARQDLEAGRGMSGEQLAQLMSERRESGGA